MIYLVCEVEESFGVRFSKITAGQRTAAILKIEDHCLGSNDNHQEFAQARITALVSDTLCHPQRL